MVIQEPAGRPRGRASGRVDGPDSATLRRMPRRLVAVLVLSACGLDPKLSVLEEKLFVPRCNTSGCHDAGGKAGQLDLTPGKAFAQLVNRPALNVGASDDALLRVKPGDPDHSFLVLKLRDHVPVAYGVRMPANGAPPTADELAAVAAWVEGGAPND